MPKSPSLPPEPAIGVGIARLDYSQRVDKTEFQRALDTNFDAEISEIYKHHDGRLTFTDGSAFRISYVTHNGAHRLTMDRMPGSGNTLQRWIFSVLDNLGQTGAIRRAVKDVARQGQALATRLNAQIPGIVDGLWKQELSLQLEADNNTFDSHEVSAWLGDSGRNGIFQQRCVVAVGSSEDGVLRKKKLTATFRVGAHSQQIEFHCPVGANDENRPRADRDLERMERVIRGDYASRLGTYHSAREMMAIFKMATIVEEGELQLRQLARNSVPREEEIDRGSVFAQGEEAAKRAFYLSVTANAPGRLADDTAKAIDMALWLSSGRLLSEAARAAQQFAAPIVRTPEAAASQDLLEFHTNEIFAVADREIAAELSNHPFDTFCARFLQNLGASRKDVELLEKHAGEFGNHINGLPHVVGSRHTSGKDFDKAPPHTQYVVFDRKLSPWEQAVRLLTCDHRNTRSNDMPPSSIGVGHEDGQTPNKLFKLCLRDYPACLRFMVGKADQTMPKILVRTHYDDFNEIVRELYQSLNDERMHEIANKVQPKVDEEVEKMRADMRADLQQGLVRRFHRARFQWGLKPDLPVEQRELREHTFEQGQECLARLGKSHDPKQRVRLLKLYNLGLSGLPQTVANMAEIDEAGTLAYDTGKHNRAAIRDSLAHTDAALQRSMELTLHDTFAAGLLPPSLAETWQLRTPSERVVGDSRPAAAVELAHALVELAHASHDLKRADREHEEADDKAKTWLNLSGSGQVHREANQARAYKVALDMAGEARQRRDELVHQYRHIHGRIKSICMNGGMTPVEANYVAEGAIGEGDAMPPPPTENVSLSAEELRARRAALRTTAQRARQLAQSIDVLVDERERELRARTDLIVVGRTTLGALNRWKESEAVYAWNEFPTMRPAKPSVPASQAVPAEPAPQVAEANAAQANVAAANVPAQAEAAAGGSGAIPQPSGPTEQKRGHAPATLATVLERTVSDSSVVPNRLRKRGAVTDESRSRPPAPRRHTESDIVVDMP